MKVLNIKALYDFDGYVVDKISCQKIGAQINLRFDKRRGPCCPIRHGPFSSVFLRSSLARLDWISRYSEARRRVRAFASGSAFCSTAFLAAAFFAFGLRLRPIL